MTSSYLPAPSSVTSESDRAPLPDGEGAAGMSTTRLLRAVTEGLPQKPPRRSATRWRDRRAAWLTLPPGWTRVQVGDLVIAVPGPTPGGTTLLLVVEPVRVVASGSIEVDFGRAASEPGLWFPGDPPTPRETIEGWTFLVGSGHLALNGASYAAVTAVARRNALRARFWALADSEDTRARYESAVLDAITSVRGFVEGAARDRVG